MLRGQWQKLKRTEGRRAEVTMAKLKTETLESTAVEVENCALPRSARLYNVFLV